MLTWIIISKESVFTDYPFADDNRRTNYRPRRTAAGRTAPTTGRLGFGRRRKSDQSATPGLSGTHGQPRQHQQPAHLPRPPPESGTSALRARPGSPSAQSRGGCKRPLPTCQSLTCGSAPVAPAADGHSALAQVASKRARRRRCARSQSCVSQRINPCFARHRPRGFQTWTDDRRRVRTHPPRTPHPLPAARSRPLGAYRRTRAPSSDAGCRPLPCRYPRHGHARCPLRRGFAACRTRESEAFGRPQR